MYNGKDPLHDHYYLLCYYYYHDSLFKQNKPRHELEKEEGGQLSFSFQILITSLLDRIDSFTNSPDRDL